MRIPRNRLLSGRSERVLTGVTMGMALLAGLSVVEASAQGFVEPAASASVMTERSRIGPSLSPAASFALLSDPFLRPGFGRSGSLNQGEFLWLATQWQQQRASRQGDRGGMPSRLGRSSSMGSTRLGMDRFGGRPTSRISQSRGGSLRDAGRVPGGGASRYFNRGVIQRDRTSRPHDPFGRR